MGVTQKEVLLTVKSVQKDYPTGTNQSLSVLKGVDLKVKKGEIVAIVGPSGAGKSTLLHILGGLDRPTSGEVEIDGQDLFSYSEEELANFRNRSLGFIFQFHHLLPEFSALENVAMPALINGESLKAAATRAEALLQEVGLGERLDHKPSELSGGEQQRVAVARALMNRPKLILADEPSGNLDEQNGKKLHDLLVELSKGEELTFVIATHNPDLTSRAHRILRLHDGKLSTVKL